MQTRVWTCLTGVCAFFIAFVTFAAPVDLSRMERAIDLRVSTGQFMGSVLVARDGKVLIDKGYGLADLASKTPNGAKTKFRLGSVTKQFTAACILLLEERGKLDVQDPVKRYLPDAPAAWDRITIFNLLTHTSGIPSYTGFSDYQATQGNPVTPEQLVARFRDKPLEFPPGTAYAYSNSGYSLLGYLIERISGASYARFVHDNLFVPLGMKDSGYDSSTDKIPRHATGYVQGHDGPVVAGYLDMSVPFSAGALYSTTEDLLRWERGLYGGKVLKPASLEKMTTPFKSQYAFGLQVEPGSSGGKIIWHGGAIEGFNTQVVYVTTDKLAVIVLANLNGAAADNIAADLRKVAEGETVTLISDRVAVAVSSEVLGRRTGHYLTADGIVTTVSLKDDHLQSQDGGRTLDLYPQSETEFFAKTEDVQESFSDEADAQTTDMTVARNGHQVHAHRISDAQAQQLSDALAEKVRDQTATPGSEAAVRQWIAEIAAGTVDYEQLGFSLAEILRQQLPQLQQSFQKLGAIKSVEFKGVGPAGADIYNVTLEHGALEARISLGPNGKIWSAGIRPLR
jgi:CubicO group peptidase (beta-lactamase class C family)